MCIRHLSLAALLTLQFSFSSSIWAAEREARSCGLTHKNENKAGGIVGTGHNPVIPPGGIGGTGHEPTLPPGGLGGTGHDPIPPGGIGGTGISSAGYLSIVHGNVFVHTDNDQNFRLISGDAICSGDHLTSSNNGMAKMIFADGATLYILKNTDLKIDDYYYPAQTPEQGRSLLTLKQGDIRSVSGALSKANPKDYKFQTPSAIIQVIGTDFLITHLVEPQGALDAGTYTKVSSGEVSVKSISSTLYLKAGESSHVGLNGSQSMISKSGGLSTGSGGQSSGTCTIP